MAVRQAVAANVNITYKILFNDAVAMTGGQPVDGQITVPMIARQSHDEGVKKIAVVSDEPEKYHGHKGEFPAGVTFHHRDELDGLQRELREIPGCTVLIYDQTCAAEKRRRRKRGTFPDPAKRAFINHHVCEGCGDCSVQSNCLSLFPKETELGRKRKIDQSSCNKDFSCVSGFCPSFVTIEGGELRKPRGIEADTTFWERVDRLPEPELPEMDGTYDLLVGGVGGTGVITVGQLITMAAHLEGKGTSVLDFMGFAQKGGAVLSYVRLAGQPQELNQVRIEEGQADALIACDLVVASSQKALNVLHKGHTRIVANQAELPTADYVLYRDADMTSGKRLQLLKDAVGEEHFSELNANLAAEQLLGDTVFSNVLLLGYAWQKGLLPLSRAALMQALELNAVAVEKNRQAFAWGCLAAVEPDYLEQQLDLRPLPDTASLNEVLGRHARYLEQYQNKAWAERYLQKVAEVRKAEGQLAEESTALSEAVAEQLFRLMAYKDEYEVARLFTETDFLKEIEETFSGDFKINFHLAPPLLNGKKDRSGRPKKRQFGPWMLKAMKLLARMRGMRNSALDPFRFSEDRKLDRRLLADYEALIDQLLAGLKAENLHTAVALARLPEEVRGFGPVREDAAEKAEKRKQQLLEEFKSGKPKTLAVAA